MDRIDELTKRTGKPHVYLWSLRYDADEHGPEESLREWLVAGGGTLKEYEWCERMDRVWELTETHTPRRGKS